MSNWLGANSISAKLTWLNLLVTGTALLLACLAFLAFDYYSYRANLIQNLFAEAQMTGTNSVSALMFDDPQTATATLNALKGSPDVTSAAIVAEDGQLFAEYPNPGSAASIKRYVLSPTAEKTQWVHGSQVVVGYRISFSGKSVGVVYIQAHLRELKQRMQRYGIAAGLILLGCMIAALLATTAFRRLVTEPIIALAGTARIVSREKDFSLRAETTAKQNEIAVLVESFNEMLHEIQVRDVALRDAHELLERRVEERTAELWAANRELESFSYSVAHDLRGPLDVISGLSYLVQHNYQEKLDGEGTEMLNTVQRQARNMAALIDDLLNLARATTVGMERKRVDLTAMARSIAEDLSTAEPERKVDFKIAEGAIANADRGLIFVVMDNLIRNAWKYTSRHKTATIEFGWTPQKGKKVFFVRDDGAGFDSSKADKLFRPFQRLHAASEFPGTGIGLATVQRIIARHGGSVWAEGKTERGATFYFTV